MEVLSEYKAGYEKARLVDREVADNYIAHTRIGDPIMDAVVEELASLPQSEASQFLRAGMDEDHEGMRNAPKLLRDFFIDSPQPDPEWLDQSAFAPGVRAFQRNSVAILSAFVTGVLIDGFATLISKSFVQTGRIFDDGVWRLKQNNRHQMEIFWPGGLERHGDGWKLSVRVRFVHARFVGCLHRLKSGSTMPGVCRSAPRTWAMRVPVSPLVQSNTRRRWELVTARRSAPASTLSGATRVILWASLRRSYSPMRATPCTYTGSAPCVSPLQHRTRSS